MESTGEKGKIQISDATAKELDRLDKSNWYKERIGGVEAKGKGIMKTYWLIPSQTKLASVTTASRTSGGSQPDPEQYMLDDVSMSQRNPTALSTSTKSASTRFMFPSTKKNDTTTTNNNSHNLAVSSNHQSYVKDTTIIEQDSFSSANYEV